MMKLQNFAAEFSGPSYILTPAADHSFSVQFTYKVDGISSNFHFIPFRRASHLGLQQKGK